MDLKKLIIFFTIYFSCLSIIGEDSVIHWDINNSFINSIYKEKNVLSARVDAIGIGAGVAPHMQRLGCSATAVFNGEK